MVRRVDRGLVPGALRIPGLGWLLPSEELDPRHPFGRRKGSKNRPKSQEQDDE